MIWGRKIKEMKGKPESDLVALHYHFLVDFPDSFLSLTLEITGVFSSVAESLSACNEFLYTFIGLLGTCKWNTLIYLFSMSEFLSFSFLPIFFSFVYFLHLLQK